MRDHPEGKEERDAAHPASFPAPSTSSPFPVQHPLPAAAAPGSRPKGPAPSTRVRPPAPALPAKSRAHPGAHLLNALSVPRVSPTDLVATITFPALGGRGLSTLPRPARHNGSSMVGASNAAHLLEKSLHIPPPRLLKALSRFDSPEDLLGHLTSLLATHAGSLLSTLGPYVTQLQTAVNLMNTNAVDALAQVAEALYSTPSGMDAFCHDSYMDYLNSRTAVIKSHQTPAKEQRHVIRIGLNSPLTQLVMLHHIERYAALLCPSPSPAPSRADIAELQPWQAEWTRRCIPTSAIHSTLQLAPYEYRYETTRVSGFIRGPDCNPPLENHDSLGEPFGSLNSFLAFLAAVAPHCYAGKVAYTADGRASLQFVHEMPYRSELFRLHGMTSPRHGIIRPVRLSYFQQQVPAARCCSHCGEGAHQAHSCPVRAASDEADAAAVMDTGLPVHPPGRRAGVCRDCYSSGHQQTCDTNPASVTCKLCNETGHTSFHCSQYRARWIPLSLPTVTAPMSTRPLIISRIQQGLPWNAVATPTPPPPTGLAPPPASAFPPLQPSSAAARVRPSAQPASPTVSSSSSVRQPRSPVSPYTPTSANDDRFNQLQQTILTMQAESKAFQERQAQQFQQLQQQQLQLQTQLQGLQTQLHTQAQSFKEYVGSMDTRFFTLLHHLGMGPGPGPVTTPGFPASPPPITAYMQTGSPSPPTTPPSGLHPTDQAAPATASPHPTQPWSPATVQVSIAQSVAPNASVGSFHFSLPSGANSMAGPSGPPPYPHQQTSSSSTPSTGPVSNPQ